MRIYSCAGYITGLGLIFFRQHRHSTCSPIKAIRIRYGSAKMLLIISCRFISLAAAFFPARNAAKLDPALALRR